MKPPLTPSKLSLGGDAGPPLLYPLSDLSPEDLSTVGGKSAALARMKAAGFNIPETLCIGSNAYREYVETTGLRPSIFLELNRKPLETMRWEEIWDTATRIRHLFSATPMPEPMETALRKAISERFGDRPVMVRSSAVDEDSAHHSFAGLHESVANVRGADAVLDAVRNVWASLWSDRALLYRRELVLDPASSEMAVAVQEMVAGECSGIIFSQSFSDASRMIVEAVYGLNHGLVNGDITPYRWQLDRESGDILHFENGGQTRLTVPGPRGVELAPLPAQKAHLQRFPAPLSAGRIRRLFETARSLESLFGAPQDVEWTFAKVELSHSDLGKVELSHSDLGKVELSHSDLGKVELSHSDDGDRLFILQSRPITANAREPDAAEKDRLRHLSRHWSIDHLDDLRRRVEEERLPRMAGDAEAMADVNLCVLSDQALATEIRRRERIFRHWRDIYHDEFIPLAHGIRRFGRFYNDAVRPVNPFEFQDLLTGTGMISLRRNQLLTEMVHRVRSDGDLAGILKRGEEVPESAPFSELLDAFLADFGACAWGNGLIHDRTAVVQLVLKMASGAISPPTGVNVAQAEADYMSRFDEPEKPMARRMLQLGRDCYRLRDDDNIYLGRIEGRMRLAVNEGLRRVKRGMGDAFPTVPPSLSAERMAGEVTKALEAPDYLPNFNEMAAESGETEQVSARQLVGQPAGPGIAIGTARVVRAAHDLFRFESGEILVCDAIDPNMTFIVPMAAGIVERRGGMLIHGAIIAREYGIPCVTGVPDAAERIRTGDEITVDGFLGIVIRHSPGSRL